MKRALLSSLLAAGLLVGACSSDDASEPSASDADRPADAGGSSRDVEEEPGGGAGDDDTDDAGGGGGTAPDGTDSGPSDGARPGSDPVEPATLAMREPELAERLCAVDPRISMPDLSADAGPEEVRQAVEVAQDPVAELVASLPAVEGGAELAALLDAVVAGWTEAVRAYDEGDEGAARQAIADARADLDEARSRADTVLAACGRS